MNEIARDRAVARPASRRRPVPPLVSSFVVNAELLSQDCSGAGGRALGS